jgi:hypothetical protein
VVPDSKDLTARLRAVLPLRWFPDEAPVLDTVLSGLASGWTRLFDLLAYARAQARIATATEEWLDLIAVDFFGQGLKRGRQQSDTDFRQRIRAELLRERGTRYGLQSVLRDLTGREPSIFEPANPRDAGGYRGSSGNGGGVAYGIAGGWGSLALPYQAFVTAYRQPAAGIAAVAGWGASAGAYGGGCIEYASVAMIAGRVTDADINQAIVSVLPANAVCWVRISS